jgi:3-methylcrotonyl-CoA carboxylase beta subunit
MAKVPLLPLGSSLKDFMDPSYFTKNQEELQVLEKELIHNRQVVQQGWGESYQERVHSKQKLTLWERLEVLADPGSSLYPIGTFVNWYEEFYDGAKNRKSPAAGVVTVFVRVSGLYTVVIANDNTVASGSWWPRSPEKIERAQEIARRLRLPVIYLIDCSGLNLPNQSKTFPGAQGAGHIFKMNSLLSDAQVPQIAGVFGDCIAGGGYMPIISDKVFMTEQAYMVIAGTGIIKGAKSQKLTALQIGGPDVHCHISACADERAPDDTAVLQLIRKEIAKLPSSGAAFYRFFTEASEPLYPASEISGLIPRDHKLNYDIRQILARLVDSSLFWEILPEQGKEMVCGIARINGLYVGIIANNQEPTLSPQTGEMRAGGILYKEGIAKISLFSRTCDHDGIPLIWLQDIAGFDIGVEAEKFGLLGYGSSLIYTNSTNQTPMITVLLRKASGAGYYAMAGLPYDPILQLSTPLTRLAVMEGHTLAIATYSHVLDDQFEYPLHPERFKELQKHYEKQNIFKTLETIAQEEQLKKEQILQGMHEVEKRILQDMDPYRSANQMDTDEIIPFTEIREYLKVAVELCYQSTGYRRVKNPRIWGLHDIAALSL